MTTLKTAAEVAHEICTLNANSFDGEPPISETESIIQQFLNGHLQAQHEKTWEIAIEECAASCDKWSSMYNKSGEIAPAIVCMNRAVQIRAIPCPPINESTNNG